jgi:hypothetical protein
VQLFQHLYFYIKLFTMRKIYILFSFLSICYNAYSQVGINTTTPKAQLEIKSSNQATPANNDGILIPKIDAFPTINPTAAQDGMMVYLTQLAGIFTPGFYYWDNGTTTWKSIGKSHYWGYDNSTPNFEDVAMHKGGVVVGKDYIELIDEYNSNTDNIVNESAKIFNYFNNNSNGFGTPQKTIGIRNKVSATDYSGSQVYGIKNIVKGTSQNYLNGLENNISGNNQYGDLIAVGISNKIGSYNFSANTIIGTNNDFTARYSEIYGTKTTINEILAFNNKPLFGNYNNITTADGNFHSGNAYGIKSEIGGAGAGNHYGNFQSLSSTGYGNKYGSYNLIEPSAGGTHYGLYSEVLKTDSFAGFFLGNVAIGTTTANNYILPKTRGTTNQIIQTDGLGNSSWVTPSFSYTENDPKITSATTNKVPKWNGTNLMDGIIHDNATNVGIGTTNPQSKLEIVSAGTTEFKISSTSAFGASRLSMISDKDLTNEWRPAFLESADNGGFNGRLDFYTNGSGIGAKFGSVIAMTLVDGKVGINTTNPSEKLEVAGKTKTTNLQMTTGATANFVLQSDAVGNANWVNPTSLTITETDPQVSSATTNTIPKYNGTTLVDGVMIDNGTNVGIGTTPTAGNKLEVAGKTLTSILEVTNKTTTDRFRMINGAVDKYVLQSDFNGNATWEKNNGGYTHYLGELYLGGIIFELYKGSDGLEHGLVVSPTTGSGVWQTIESVTGANRSEDGQYNTSLITNSPIQTFLTSLGSGWYLPSQDEFLLLYNHSYYIQKTLRANGLPLFEYYLYHWTSTEGNINYAIRFNSGFFSANNKYVPSRFLGIKSF